MGTKTISITDDAYKRLARLKKENESFSMVINRVTGKKKLSDFRGILSRETANELEKNIIRNREETERLHKLRIEKINEALR